MATELDGVIPDNSNAEQIDQLHTSQEFAAQRSPEDAAGTFNYAKAAGLQFEQAETQKKTLPLPAPSWGSLVKDHPVLSRYLADPGFAASAQDDVQNLSKLERLFGGWDEIAWKSKQALADDSRNQELAAIGRAMRAGTATKEQLARGDELEKEAESDKTHIGFVPGIVPSVVGGLPGMARALPTAAYYGIGGAIGGLLLTKNPKVAAGAAAGMAGAGFVAGMALDTAKTEQGLSYRQYVKAGADPASAAVASDIVALANGGLQAIPAEKVLNVVPGLRAILQGKATRDIMGRLLGSNTGRAVIARFAGRVAESGLLMALVGSGQELVKEVGAIGAGADDKLHGDRIWNAATGGAQQGLGFGFAHAALPAIAEKRQAALGEGRTEMFKAIGGIASESKLRERMPAEFKKYANDVINEHGSVAEVKLPADKLGELFQKEGIDPTTVQEQMPEVAKQMRESKPGDEIIVPTADLAAHLAHLKSFPEILPDLRFGDDLTARESKEAQKEGERIAAQKPKETDEPATPERRVYEDVYQKLVDAGQAPEVAQHDAGLWAAFAKSRGERTGVDPFDYYSKRALSIGAEMGDISLGQREPRLIVQHNLSEENLRHVDEALGGYLPAPSIGIAKKEHPLSAFGDITLLAKPGLIDPAKGVPVKGADIYSTRHPRPRFKVNEKNLRTLMAELKPSKEATGGYTSDLAERINEHGIDAALRDRDTRKVFEHAFLLDQGKKVEQKTREKPLFQSDIAKTKAMSEFFEKNGIEGNHEFGGAYHKGLSDAVRAAIREVSEKLPEEDREDYVKLHDEWFGISKDDKGLVDFSKTWKFVQDAANKGKVETDPHAMEDQVSKQVDEIGRAKFEKWAKEKIKDAVGEPYIRKFSENTGNEIRRAYTVDNILREMTKKLARGEANMYGFGWARAEGAPRFRSMEAIQKADKTIIPSAEFEKIKDALNEEGANIGTKLSSLSDNPNAFGSLDSFVEAVAESYRRGHYLSKELELSGFKNVPPDLLREIQDFAEKLRKAPTEYFEAKPQRAVHLSEFQAAVVPESASKEARAILEKHGLKLYDYKHQWNVERERRENVIASAAEKENVLFQKNEEPLRFQASFQNNDTKEIVNTGPFHDLSQLPGGTNAHASGKWTDGFTDQNGEFYTRDEAAKALKTTGKELASGGLATEDLNRMGMPASYFQETAKGEGYRGKISFDKARSYFRVTLTGKANLSTFLHESGHAFFEFVRKDAEEGHAGSLEDFGKLREWLGVKDGEEPSVDQLETFAKGFETYLAEGKAPAAGLRDAFRAFKTWLKLVYKSISNLGVNLTDDVRGVMDRMLATDGEIEEARQNIGFEPMEKPKEMPEGEYTAYKERFAKAVQKSRDELEAQALKEFSKTIGEERAKVRGEVEEATKHDPVHNAYEALRTGKRLDGEPIPEEIQGKKLSREAVREFPGYSDTKKWTSITSPDGLDPEVAAPYYGFKNGQEMLDKLAARQSRTKEIKEQTDARMKERYPDAEMGKMAEQAVKAVHNEDVTDVLWKEAETTAKYLTGLEAQANKDKPPLRFQKAVIKETAKRRVEGMTMLEMQPGRFARAEESAAADSAKAFKKGDFEEAQAKKLEQIANHELWKRVSDAKDEVNGIRDYLAKFEDLSTRRRIGKAGQMYLNAIDKLLEDVDLKKVSNKDLSRRASLESYLKEIEDEGGTISIPNDLRSEAGLKNFKQMTLEDLRAVHDAVANIEAMARLKNRLFDGRESRNFHETAVKGGEHIRSNLGTPFAEKAGAPQNPGWWEQKKSWLRESRAEKKKIEFIARELDGGQTAGLMHNLLFQPFATAAGKMHEWTKKVTEELVKPLREMSFKERIELDKTTDFLGTPMKLRDVIAVALNMGNDGNKKKLLEGYAYRGWDEDKVTQRLGELLTDKHLDLIQHFWTTINSLWPEIKALSERTTGVAPPKVEAAKLYIRGRELEGGYYPVVYDRERSYKAEQIAQRKGDLFENNFLKPGVSKGFTEARTQFSAPLLLSLNVIPSHINEVIHYLTHYEPVRAVDRLLAHGEMRQAITEGLGRETYNLFRPWLQAIAHDGVIPSNLTGVDNILRHLRVGAAVTRLGFRLTNSIMQGFNLLSSYKELGGAVSGTKYLGLGIKRWMEDLDSFRDPFAHVIENSPEIAGKTKNMERELIANFDHYTSAFSEFGHMKERLGHFAMSFMTLAWRTCDTITWYAAREKAFDEAHPRPNEYADSVVRLAQMGEGIKDKAAIMRGGEGTRIFTNMYSWYSTIYNQLTETQPQTRGGWAKAGELASRWWWMVLAPTVLMGISRGKGPKKDKDDAGSWLKFYGEEIALEAAKPWPVAGVVADTILSEHESRFGPWISTVLRGVKARGKMMAGEKLTEHEKQDLVQSTGITSHLPATALWNAHKYVSAVQDGKLEEPIRDLLFRAPGEWK